MNCCSAFILTHSAFFVLLSLHSVASADDAWIKSDAAFPKDFTAVNQTKRNLPTIHGNGTPLLLLSGVIDGHKAELNGSDEDAHASVYVEAEFRKISISADYLGLPLNWHGRCTSLLQKISCDISRPIYGAKQSEETTFQLRGGEGTVCLLGAGHQPVNATIVIEHLRLETSTSSGCLSLPDSTKLLEILDDSKAKVVNFNTSDGERRSNLSGISAALKVLNWLQENSFVPTTEMFLKAYEQRFFACGWMSAEAVVRSNNLTLTEMLDVVTGASFRIGPLRGFPESEARMQMAFLEGAGKYDGEESKETALRRAFEVCKMIPYSRYLVGWRLKYP